MSVQKIATHPNVDIDAVASLALLNVSANRVHFVPAGALEPICTCCQMAIQVLVDHPLGTKGEFSGGVQHSALATLVPDADKDLIAEVDEQDSTGKVDRPRFSLGAILAGLRIELIENGFDDRELDREIIRTLAPVIRGLNRLGKRAEQSRQEAESVPIEMVGEHKFALLIDDDHGPTLGIALNEAGVVGSVYVDGQNLGVTRYPGRTAPDLTGLETHLPGWFCHKAGFLAAWGSRKSPATSKPPEGTPQNAEELLALLRRVFGKE